MLSIYSNRLRAVFHGQLDVDLQNIEIGERFIYQRYHAKIGEPMLNQYDERE